MTAAQPTPLGWHPNGTPTSRIPRLRKREGRCYELALRGCLKAPEWELVHGECHGHRGTRIGHAWLEFDGEAYCPVMDECLPIPVFELRLGAVVHARYTADEALFMKTAPSAHGAVESDNVAQSLTLEHMFF